MLFLGKTILQNCLLLLKWPILAVLTEGEIQIFQISSKKSFITSTTGQVLAEAVQVYTNDLQQNMTDCIPNCTQIMTVFLFRLSLPRFWLSVCLVFWGTNFFPSQSFEPTVASMKSVFDHSDIYLFVVLTSHLTGFCTLKLFSDCSVNYLKNV